MSKHIIIMTDEGLRTLITLIRKEARELGYQPGIPKRHWSTKLLRLNRAAKPIFEAMYPPEPESSEHGDGTVGPVGV